MRKTRRERNIRDVPERRKGRYKRREFEEICRNPAPGARWENESRGGGQVPSETGK